MTDTIKMVMVRITAWDCDGDQHRINVVVPSPFTEKQAMTAAAKEIGREIVRVAFN